MIEIDKLEKKLEKDPSSIVFVQLAEEYRKMGRIDDAINVCIEGIKHHPNYWTAYILLAKCYFEKEEYEKSKEYLEQALSGSPDNIQAISLIAETYEKLNIWDKALDKYRILQLLSPNQETENKIKFIEEKIEYKKIEETPTVQFSMSLIKETLSEGKKSDNLQESKEVKDNVLTNDTGQIIKEKIEEVEEEKFAEYNKNEIQLKVDAKENKKPIEFLSFIQQDDLKEKKLQLEKEKEKYEIEDKEITTEISTQTLGEIYASQGCYEKAIKIYQKIILVEPNNIAAINRLRELIEEFNKINIRTNKQFFKEESIQEDYQKGKLDQKTDERRKRISTLESWLSTIRKEKKS